MGFEPKNLKIRNRLQKIQSEFNKIPPEATKVFKKTTPIDTGNARRKTDLKSQNTIVANYPYANRLNEGYSRQAPEGMTEPTIKYIRRRVRKILGR